ncbi:hypothetical protein [Pseudodesulfovibrio sp.]|uniref:hypothetical protein n=1 Tax=unclassified Pseudodesulfovibrio TaxID=2661612 RepID=UPI003AFF950A
MTKREATRTARCQQLAEFLQEAITKGRSDLALVEILPKFSGEAAFTRLSGLHVFVDGQYVTAPHPGPGGHHPRTIRLDSMAKRYVERILGREAYLDMIPDGAPLGDSIFSSAIER